MNSIILDIESDPKLDAEAPYASERAYSRKRAKVWILGMIFVTLVITMITCAATGFMVYEDKTSLTGLWNMTNSIMESIKMSKPIELKAKKNDHQDTPKITIVLDSEPEASTPKGSYVKSYRINSKGEQVVEYIDDALFDEWLKSSNVYRV